ncbi:hypothetical protein [Tessaracoccus massiliensis]|uniref:hypothetical protein n=1 Tax=Tessaracoccus massiliensis TaxID=1522311 RepID=UPI00058C73B3|nr:hypothetical protein [Tessaracoccus massiliensis]
MQPLSIPSHLDTPEGPTTVTRAWFERIDEGLRRLSFEGRDEEGRLRAGLVWFDDDARPARVELTRYGRDKKLPALERLLADGELLVHRAGRRAVVRTPDGFAKALRPAKLPDAEARARAFHHLRGPVRTPEVLRVDDDGALTVGIVPGRSLHDLGVDAGTFTWREGWRAWAESWADWVRTPGLGDALPRYTVDDEEQTLTGWLLRVELARPSGLALTTLRERFGSVMESLHGLERDVWHLSHRDLHDKQILVSSFPEPGARELASAASGRRAAGLIDSDTLAMADPAVDLGNLLAHVRLREAQGLLNPTRTELAEALICEIADNLDVPGPALHAWRDAASLRLSCVYAFRPTGTAS